MRLLEVYESLAGENLLGTLLGGQTPRRWAHYPQNDAIDFESGYQWFYHSHSPEDRPGAAEHGHIHLFARRKLWSRRLQSKAEQEFASLSKPAAPSVNTRHLLSIAFNAKGIPISLFTVNSWVTGDRMLGAPLSAELLENISLNTGHPAIDAVIESLVQLYRDEIARLLVQRDKRLFNWKGEDVLNDQRLEVLSESAIDVDRKLANCR
jgi:hypothetical protein